MASQIRSLPSPRSHLDVLQPHDLDDAVGWANDPSLLSEDAMMPRLGRSDQYLVEPEVAFALVSSEIFVLLIDTSWC